MGLIFYCKQTFWTEIPACWETITANLGVVDTTYHYIITTPYGKQYRKEVTVADGDFELLAADFPEELFNPWAGAFHMQLFRGNECQPVEFTVCDETFNTIGIRVVQVKTAPDEILLLCQCPVD